MRPRSAWLALGAAGLLACSSTPPNEASGGGGTTSSISSTSATGGGGSAPTSGSGGTGGGSGGGCVSPNAKGGASSVATWCEVDAVLDQSLATSKVGTSKLPGYAFEVFTFDETKGEPVERYGRADGKIDDETATVTMPIKTASAAKMVTALLLSRAAVVANSGGANLLTIATPASVLNCDGVDPEIANATLDELMHQIAGLKPTPQNPCVQSLSVPLATCACDILRDDYVAADRGTFAYTPHNFAVAAAIADAVLAKLATPTDMRAVFADFTETLGIASEAALSPSNDFAGGDHLSARAYGTMLALALPGPARGTYHHATLLDASFLDRMTTPFGDDVALTYSPYLQAVGLKMRYGFGDWVECGPAWSEPAKWPAVDAPIVSLDYGSCATKVVNSLGKFGYLPWFAPRAEAPYAAVLAVDLDDGDSLVSADTFATYEMLDPLLRVAIDASSK